MAVVRDMEKRNEVYEMKKAEKLERKKDQEMQKEKEKQEAKKLADKKLLNAKVPEGSRRLTKSAENRASIVRKSFQDQDLAIKKEAEEDQKRKDRLKTASLVVRKIVNGFDQSRKELFGKSYVSLRNADEVKAKSVEERINFRKLLREKREEIKVSAKNKPSLIERHDAAVAADRAHTSALGRLANAVGAKSEFTSKSLELFSDDEQLKISMRHNSSSDYDYKDDFN